MRSYIALSVLAVHTFMVWPCAAQESALLSQTRPLDLSLPRTVFSPHGLHDAKQLPELKQLPKRDLGKMIAAAAVRPCLSPAYPQVDQFPSVSPSSESSSAIDATENAPLAVFSAVWLASQAASGACRM
jgi:hypothetical protein